MVCAVCSEGWVFRFLPHAIIFYFFFATFHRASFLNLGIVVLKGRMECVVQSFSFRHPLKAGTALFLTPEILHVGQSVPLVCSVYTLVLEGTKQLAVEVIIYR
ncbi:unnamed protein product [Hapterophycus canaliculatus]